MRCDIPVAIVRFNSRDWFVFVLVGTRPLNRSWVVQASYALESNFSRWGLPGNVNTKGSLVIDVRKKKKVIRELQMCN